MKREIFYFTGSGHSLIVARDLAEKMGSTLTPIPALRKHEQITSQADVIGLVFPVYHATFGESGLPDLVRRFIDKLQGLEGKYIFAVCSHSGFPGLTLEKLAQRIAGRDGELAAGYTVQLHIPYNTMEKMRYEFFHQPLSFDEQEEQHKRQRKLDEWHARLPYIVNVIEKQMKGIMNTPGLLQKLFLGPFMALQKMMAMGHFQKLVGSKCNDFWALTSQADRTFRVSESCTACGTCARVCPVQNIEMVDNRPQWQHHCENCTACYHWCPTGAISGEMVGYEKRVEPAGVSLKDMLHQSRLIT